MIESPIDHSDLVAVYINCTLKRSPEVSNTQGLMDRSIELMRSQGVERDLDPVRRSRRRHRGLPRYARARLGEDAWPDEIWPLIDAADILVIGGPLWLGDNAASPAGSSSVSTP